MRSRSNSCVRLDYYHNLVYKTILTYQDPVTGMLPANQSGGTLLHAWVRDNVYSVTSVWALAMAYRKTADLDEDRAKTYQLEQATVKCMRGLLMAMMGQREKVERFKKSYSAADALHAKYSSTTGQPVVGDEEWGHLQMDSISLYLLTLAQMTASGLQIIFTLDEVAFVQNLVFYIECAYVIPDYGIWERGDKSNQGVLELNASSVGMAKAALEAMNELDMFGARGGPASVIHILPDEAVKCGAVLESMLPRESNSKETDAAILGIIGYPAFSVTSRSLINRTRATVQEKLGGRYGMKRFLRDGYRCPKEDPNRLHYEPWELRIFENIECEWPLFHCYQIIDNCFQGELGLAGELIDSLEEVTVKKTGLRMVPELYKVPEESVNEEYASPGTAEREAAGRCPFMWAQSLYITGKLLQEDLLAPGELDPMNRRLSMLKKPDVVVQVVVIAEDNDVKNMMAEHNVILQTKEEIAPIQVQPASMLSHLYTFLGRSKKLGLTGRRSHDVGILATSKIYQIQDKTFVFTPQVFDTKMNYTDTDPSLAMSTLAYGLNFLSTSWTDIGRPTITLILSSTMFEGDTIPLPLLTTMRKLKSGYINGTRVALGTHSMFTTTSCFTDLAFLGNVEEGQPDRLDPEVIQYLEQELGGHAVNVKGLLEFKGTGSKKSTANVWQRGLVGSIKRSRSIRVPEGEAIDIQALAKASDNVAKISVTNPMTPDLDPMDPLSRAVRQRIESESCYADQEAEDLVTMLQETHDLEEQGDILQYMSVCHGMNHVVAVDGRLASVADLVKDLYEKACKGKHWGIVRHASGLLCKKLPDLAKSVTDLIVRQKQVTVGLPPDREVIISRPLGAMELRSIISRAHAGDTSTSALSQEILIYLAMFIRTEPQLFHGMLRLRVGLIIQVMASELARSLGICGDDAADTLLNLSPFETKNLLHHLMSGQEYGVQESCSQSGSKISIVAKESFVTHSRRASGGNLSFYPTRDITVEQFGEGVEEEKEDKFGRAGCWLRRRRLDGALNRVPAGFYTRLWGVLEKCQGLSVMGKVLPQTLTQEMTSGEMKFHLKCEAVLNTISEPEFRQLLVEALMVLILVVEYNVVPYLGPTINVEDLVRTANTIFLQDQLKQDGDATQCCAHKDSGKCANPARCGGAAGMCVHLYDSAPSGTYGSMSYLVRATCSVLNTIPPEGNIDCSVM